MIAKIKYSYFDPKVLNILDYSVFYNLNANVHMGSVEALEGAHAIQLSIMLYSLCMKFQVEFDIFKINLKSCLV